MFEWLEPCIHRCSWCKWRLSYSWCTLQARLGTCLCAYLGTCLSFHNVFITCLQHVSSSNHSSLSSILDITCLVIRNNNNIVNPDLKCLHFLIGATILFPPFQTKLIITSTWHLLIVCWYFDIVCFYFDIVCLYIDRQNMSQYIRT